MTRGWKRLLWTLPLVFLIGGGALWLKACFGPDTSLEFTWELHPDLPMDRFAAGRVGILQPFYARSYLVVAYRYLVDHPLSREEQAEAVDLWQRRLNGTGFTMFDQEEAGPVPSVNFLETPSPEDERDDQGLPETWRAARSEFLQGPPPELKREDKRWEQMRWFQNIQKGAFRTAIRTLRSRSERWGKGDQRLKAWIQAQDLVFSSSREHPNIPGPLPVTADPLLRKDRDYQIAAATFYSQRYDDAINAFQSIGKDAESPWAKSAGYMIARCWFRKGEALEAEGRERHAEAIKAFEQALATAEAAAALPKAYTLAMELRWHAKQVRAKAAAGDPKTYDGAARYLAKAAAARAHPIERTRELAGLMVRPDATPDFGVDLGDYTILLDRLIENEGAYNTFAHREASWREGTEKPRTLSEPLLQDDLTDWVFHFRETGPKAYEYAVQRWKARKSLPWLLSALANAEPTSPGIGDLMKAAQSVPETQPGFPMAAFHRARLLVAGQHLEDARPLLDRLVALGADIVSPSALNLVKAARLPLARNNHELLDNLLREVVGIDYPIGEGSDPDETADYDLRQTAQASVSVEHAEGKALLKAYGARPVFLQADGATLLNRDVPTTVLVELARSPRTPSYLRREWLRCAWVRAVLLGQHSLADQLAPEVQKVEPELSEAMAAYLAAPEADRERQAVWILLHNPGLRWYVSQSLSARTYQPTRSGKQYDWQRGYRLKDRHPFRDSFWQNLNDLEDLKTRSWPGFWFGSGSPFAYEHPLRRVFGGRLPSGPAFLTPAEKQAVQHEIERLRSLEDGPTWLCKQTLAWAKASPDDPRVPEALHMAVRATRIGGATELSKRCFRLLHRNYGKTRWAEKTPYYF